MSARIVLYRLPMEATMSTTMNLEQRFIWESNLKPGDVVTARWTNSYNQWEARAEVVRVNGSSMRVRLVETLYSGTPQRMTYPVGHEIVLPRCVIQSRTWSQNNCAEPIAE